MKEFDDYFDTNFQERTVLSRKKEKQFNRIKALRSAFEPPQNDQLELDSISWLRENVELSELLRKFTGIATEDKEKLNATESKKELVNAFGLLIKYMYDAINADPIAKALITYTMNELILPPMKIAAMAVTDTGNTATWTDLALMYMFEFGGIENDKEKMPTVKLKGKEAPTIKQLRQHSGVEEARKKAKEATEKLPKGQSEYAISSSWTYAFGDLERSLTGDWQDLEVFLGSYTTKVVITKNEQEQVSYHFTVENESHLESLTRFVRNKEGVNYGAIPDKKRGEGIHLGGDFKQLFSWYE